MKRLIIAVAAVAGVAAVAAVGSSAFSREFPTGTAMRPRHHEVMAYRDHYASVNTPRYQTTYPGGHGR
jgi:hypothetical protein